jgi:3-methyladenine DNA glycosylase AlkD
MTAAETMKALEKLGTSQNVKIYRRHGAGDDLFGVSFANLKALHKKIGTDHRLAVELWETGNADARALATMLMDPAVVTASSAEGWLRGLRYPMLVNLLAGVLGRSPARHELLERWTRSEADAFRQCGYGLLGVMLRNDPAELPDDACRAQLERIAKEIHASPNRSRHAMNMALVSIGIYKPALREEAIRTARRIGPVDVDHGETGCKTPDAEAYILHAAKRARPGPAKAKPPVRAQARVGKATRKAAGAKPARGRAR